MTPENNKVSIKKILLILGAIVFVILLAIMTAVILKNLRISDQSNQNDIPAQAKQAFDKAQESLTSGDLPTAKSSFEKAQELYKKTGDSTHLKEIDAALSLIDHADGQQTPPQQAPAASTPVN